MGARVLGPRVGGRCRGDHGRRRPGGEASGDAAADMAALAGAARVAYGDACARAKEIAVESGARVARCRVRGDVVEVSVTVELHVPMGIGGLRVASRARAGPVGRDDVR